MLITPLCEIAYKYGTDKCPQIKHVYTPYYFSLLNPLRNEIKKVVEMGIGNYKDMIHVPHVFDDRLKRVYERGASLKMWRDFFPNAQVYGVDILPETMFEDERIKTIVCDERKRTDIQKLVEFTGSDIDLFVDDGSHLSTNQIFLCKHIMPLLDKKVIYIIEDVLPKRLPKILQELSDYDLEVPDLPDKHHGDTCLVVVRHK